MIEGLKKLKREIGALYFAYRNPCTPWYAKVVAMMVVGYALSPIDLIPDFIPVLGYLDDAILLPIGIALAIKLIPVSIMEESRIRAEKEFEQNRKNNWIAAGVVIIIWILVIGLLFSGARFFVTDRADKQAKDYVAAITSLEGVERLTDSTEFNLEAENTANCILILSNQSYEDVFSENDQRWMVVSYWPNSDLLDRYVTNEPFGWK